MLNVIMLSVVTPNVVAPKRQSKVCNNLATDGSKVVEHSAHLPKTEGSNLAPNTGREKLA